MELTDQTINHSLSFIQDALDEPTLSPFAKLTAIGAILNRFKPVTQADIREAEALAQRTN